MEALKNSLLFLSLLGSLALVSCGPGASEQAPLSPIFSKGISGGVLANDPSDPAYWSVVHLKRKTLWTKTEPVPGGMMTTTSVATLDCTAALIEKDIVITAAHCLAPETRTGPEGFNYVGSNLYAEFTQVSGPEILVTATLQHPDYKSDPKDLKTYLTNDIAIVKLEKPVMEPLKPVALYGVNLSDGQSINIRRYGYGLTNMVNEKAYAPGQVKPEQSKQDGLLRRLDGAGVIQKVSKRIIFDAKTLDAGICPGDSGGPNFTYTQGQAFLAGVTSSYGNIGTEKDLCRGRNYSILVSEYVSWIRDGIAKIKSPRP